MDSARDACRSLLMSDTAAKQAPGAWCGYVMACLALQSEYFGSSSPCFSPLRRCVTSLAPDRKIVVDAKRAAKPFPSLSTRRRCLSFSCSLHSSQTCIDHLTGSFYNLLFSSCCLNHTHTVPLSLLHTFHLVRIERRPRLRP